MRLCYLADPTSSHTVKLMTCARRTQLKTIRLGLIVSDTWHFFEDIAQYLQQEFQVQVFQEKVYHLPFLGTKINDWRLRHDLSSLLSSVDVAFFEWASVYLATASHLPKQCKVVTRLHHYELFHWGSQINWDHVDKIIVVSSGMQRAFSECFPSHAHKVRVIHGGIRLDRFKVTSKSFRGNIGTLCHLDPRKRIYELILAFHELVQAGHDVRLYIGGDELPHLGHYYRAIRRLVQHLGLDNRVTFCGLVRDTPSWYQNIDIFVSNSYSEGLQVAPMEAIASGCYTISHFWDGCEDMIDSQHIFVTDREMNDLIQRYCDACVEEQALVREQQRAIIERKCDIVSVSEKIGALIRQVNMEAS